MLRAWGQHGGRGARRRPEQTVEICRVYFAVTHHFASFAASFLCSHYFGHRSGTKRSDDLSRLSIMNTLFCYQSERILRSICHIRQRTCFELDAMHSIRFTPSLSSASIDLLLLLRPERRRTCLCKTFAITLFGQYCDCYNWRRQALEPHGRNPFGLKLDKSELVRSPLVTFKTNV